MSAPAIPFLPHIRALRESYPVWLCDVWGVVHNGVRAFPPAIDAFNQFRASGGHVVLLTNAPRPSPPILKQLADFGVPSTAFDALVTSGDATRSALKDLGTRQVLHIGPERDHTLFSDLDLNLADAGKAEIVLCTGLDDDELEGVADYQPMLAEMARRQVTFLCANPDIVVDRGGTSAPCAGALAQAYQEIGGPTVYFGKPHGPIYDLAIARLGEVTGGRIERRGILAIGDGLNTDIAGAAAAGIDALFIVGGIHFGEVVDERGTVDAERLASLFNNSERKPVAAQEALNW